MDLVIFIICLIGIGVWSMSGTFYSSQKDRVRVEEFGLGLTAKNLGKKSRRDKFIV
jgi:hypothetical protein